MKQEKNDVPMSKKEDLSGDQTERPDPFAKSKADAESLEAEAAKTFDAGTCG